jgi:hypothetical protein
MLRFEHEIIVRVGAQLIDQALRLALTAMFHQCVQVGSPSPEIVVHIDNRDARFPGAPFEACEVASQSRHITQQLVCLRKIQIVDDINDQQRRVGLVWSAAMQIRVSGRHFFPMVWLIYRGALSVRRAGTRTKAGARPGCSLAVLSRSMKPF